MTKRVPLLDPPRRYTYRSLSSLLGCGRKTLTGRLVPCWIFEAQKEQGDNPEGTCCGKCPFHQMRINDQGEPECLHWLEVTTWERLKAETLVTSIPNYTWGRELTDVYQNNPN